MVGDEIEKTRIEYVQQLEFEIRKLMQDREEFKAIAEKFEISVTFAQIILDSGGHALQAAFKFGDRMFTINVNAAKVHYFKGDSAALLDQIITAAISQLVNPVVAADATTNFEKVVHNMNNLFERGLIK